MPADKEAAQPGAKVRKPTRPACDPCNVRRVKCSHEQPCDHCRRLGLNCTYIKAQQGPRSTGKRIQALRQGGIIIGGSTDEPHHGHPPQQMGGPVSYSSAAAAAAPPNAYASGSGQGVSPSMHGARHHPYRAPMAPQHQQQQHHHTSHHQQPYGIPTGYEGPSPEASFVDTLMAQRSGSATPSHHVSMAQQQQQQSQAQHHQGYPHPHHQQQQSPYGPSPTTTASNQQQQQQQQQQAAAAWYAQVGGLDPSTYRLPDLTTSLADSMLGSDQDPLGWDVNGGAGFPLVPGDGSATMLDALGRLVPAAVATPASFDSYPGGSGRAGTGSDGLRYSVSGSGGAQAYHRRRASPSTAESDPANNSNSNVPDALSDSVLIPNLALFYERLSGIMPVFSRSWLFGRLDKEDHRTQPQFGAMLLAMSALVLIQAQDTVDRASARRRRRQAISLLEEATRLRGGLFFGEDPCLEATCTSFFLFASLFALGRHSSAWFRLREAVTLSHLAKLHEPSSYEGLDKDEQERRLRTYWLLAITERAYALQYGHPITLTGNPRARTASLRAKLGLKELADFPDLQLCLFDNVDEAFVDCFLGKCPGKECQKFTRQKALELHAAFSKDEAQQRDSDNAAASSSVEPSSSANANGNGNGASSGNGATSSREMREDSTEPLNEAATARSQAAPRPWGREPVQRADYEITRLWLSNRLWCISLSHGLLSIEDADEPLRVDHALHLARATLDTCTSLSLPSMEAHGVGLALKLYDIAVTLVLLCKDQGIAHAISESAASRPGGDRLHGGGGGGAHGSPTSNQGERGGADKLRAEIAELLHDYLSLFSKFLGGAHPYLGKLKESIAELSPERLEWGSAAFDALLRELGL